MSILQPTLYKPRPTRNKPAWIQASVTNTAYMVTGTSHNALVNKPAWLQASFLLLAYTGTRQDTLVTSQRGFKLVPLLQAFTVTNITL